MNSRITFPKFCFDHIYDPNIYDPVSLHLATFKKEGRQSKGSFHSIQMDLEAGTLSASVFTAGPATDHTQQLGPRPSRAI